MLLKCIPVEGVHVLVGGNWDDIQTAVCQELM